MSLRDLPGYLKKKKKPYADMRNMQKALAGQWIKTQEAVMLTTTSLCCKKREHAEHAQPWEKKGFQLIIT